MKKTYWVSFKLVDDCKAHGEGPEAVPLTKKEIMAVVKTIDLPADVKMQKLSIELASVDSRIAGIII